MIEELTYVEGIQNCIGGPSNIHVVKGSSAEKAKVTWDASRVTCPLMGFAVKVDSVSPLRISEGKNTSSNQNSVEVDVHPSFHYEINVFGILKTGETEGPPNPIQYFAPNARPGLSPGGIHIVSKNHTSITIGWDKINIIYKNGQISGYRVGYQQNGKNTFVNIAGEANTIYTIEGLSPGEGIRVVIQAVNDQGYGPYSNPITFYSQPLTTTRKPATGVAVISASLITSVRPPATSITSKSSSSVTTVYSGAALTQSGHTGHVTVKHTTPLTSPVSSLNHNDTKDLEVLNDSDESRASLPLILAAVGATLLLLAIIIPLMFFVCRFCCKTSIVPGKTSDDKRLMKHDFKNIDMESMDTNSMDSDPQSLTQAETNLQTTLSHPKADHLQISPLVSVIDIEPSQEISNLKPDSASYSKRERPLPTSRKTREGYPESPLSRRPDQQTQGPSSDGAGNSKPEWEPKYVSQVHFNSVKNNHISHTNNIYVRNYMKLKSIFQSKKKPDEPSIQYQSPRGFYDEFVDDFSNRPVFSRYTEGLTSYHGTPVLKTRKIEPRIMIDEPR
ncbi:hypothetical protein FSP39_002617 [Pinctada imbricata]|uniref:Fibronectin type-III domain-containing protein n=1 Tax=Pinctada imbricata TaxID=66713 RepID=A0AA88Y777_PINIB|nr:hypothetical protein FSP39_002617 [Pinctada imbricata]